MLFKACQVFIFRLGTCVFLLGGEGVNFIRFIRTSISRKKSYFKAGARYFFCNDVVDDVKSPVVYFQTD